jgi:nitroreductase
MSVKEVIYQRRSVRKYQDKEISKEVINELLDAARKAPSAKNIQSHKYFVVNDKEIIEKLKLNKSFKQPYVYRAPLIIVCCANPKLYPEIDKDHSKDYALVDLSIAASFLTLRATELGLGSVFVALLYEDKIKKALDISKDYIIPFVLAIGYPAETPDPRFKKERYEIVF